MSTSSQTTQPPTPGQCEQRPGGHQFAGGDCCRVCGVEVLRPEPLTADLYRRIHGLGGGAR